MTDVQPLYLTRRDPTLPTYGPKVAKFGDVMGRPFMPWQRLTSDLVTTVAADGHWRYRTILVTVPRQAGKTTLWTPLAAHRCMMLGRARVWWTDCRTRQDARDSWQEAAELVMDSALGQVFHQRKSNGSESLRTPNRSAWRVFAPDEDGLHGKATHLVGADEIWAVDEAEGELLEAGIVPTFATTKGQLILFSTAGTAKSTWMKRLLEQARGAVDDPTSTLALVDYSIPPEVEEIVKAGLDPQASAADRAHAIDLVAAHHPAVGYTQDRDTIQQAADTMSAGEFIRAYGNVFTGLSSGVISVTAYNLCAATSWSPPAGPVALAVDVSPDHADAAIVAAWRDDPTGPMRLDVVDWRPGVGWVLDRLVELRASWRTVPGVAISPAGPAADLAGELDRAGIPLAPITGNAYTAACGWLHRAINDGQLRHRAPIVPRDLANPTPRTPADALADAVAITDRVWVGDGAFVWSRKSSAGTITPITGGSLAARHFDHPTVIERAAPVIVSRRSRTRQAA